MNDYPTLEDGTAIDPNEALWVAVDGHFGIYCPQRFAENYVREQWHVSAADWDVLLAGPDHEEYWEVWADALDRAFYIDGAGINWRLTQDGDVWTYRDDIDDWGDCFPG